MEEVAKCLLRVVETPSADIGAPTPIIPDQYGAFYLTVTFTSSEELTVSLVIYRKLIGAAPSQMSSYVSRIRTKVDSMIPKNGGPQ
jgi:hypothetical protein